jgi:hypothetical protein
MNANALEIQGPGAVTPISPLPVTPMDMLDRALAQGAGLEMVEKIMGLQERWEANEARKAFNEAFAAFKSEAIVIVRNKAVTDGPLKGRSYAELFSFVDAATPALSKHGLSASWTITRDEEKWIEVTCTIEHVLGHAKRVALGGPPDTGGAKNPIQARVSTVTYLERATFKAACGLAEQGDDKDGQVDKKTGDHDDTRINDEQVKTLWKFIEETDTDIAKFCKHIGVDDIPQMTTSQYQRATSALGRKLLDQKGSAS